MAEVNIPAGIQPDTEKPDREERELYERLRALDGKARRHFWE